jgi:GAF domain-containing protein
MANHESPSAEYSESVPGAPLEAVLKTEELSERPARQPTRELEHNALDSLTLHLETSPATILQALADTMLSVFQCDSAGVSLVNAQTERFEWPAIAGVWAPHVGGGTPRAFGPCGDVLDCNKPLLFKSVQNRYTYFKMVAPVEEALLVPFYRKGNAVGTIWVVTHEPPHNVNSGARSTGGRFDGEDLRMLESLGRFAARAHEVWSELPLESTDPAEATSRN